jgi:hypothetical protein
MSAAEETEKAQLRLSLLALHRKTVFLGPVRNFYIMLVLLAAATGVAIYLFPTSNLVVFILIVPGFILQKTYFIDLPRSKVFLAHFEKHHPELCSWLPESALLEAQVLFNQKTV